MNTEKFSVDPSYILAGLAVASILLIVLRSIALHLISRAAARLGIEGALANGLVKRVRLLLVLLYAVACAHLLDQIPEVARYADPLLTYHLLDVETLTLSLSSLVKGALGFVILLVITKILRSLIRIYLIRKSAGADVESTADVLVYHTMLVIITFVSLSIMGLSWKLLLPVAGALGIGIGFGVRDIANNFVSGFVVLTSKTVKRGDWITLGENFGKVVDIGIRTSTLRTLDNIDIIIPNANLISSDLINWSYTDHIVRIHVPVGVSYRSDTNLVRETLLDVAGNCSEVLAEPPPDARFLEFGESSLNFELLAWIDLRKNKIPLVKSTINYMIWDAFRDRGIQIPYPQRDIHIRRD